MEREPGASDLSILLLSVTSGPKTRDLVKEMMHSGEGWRGFASDWPPQRLLIVGMYELIGNWDLAVLVRSNVVDRASLAHRFRRELMIRAHENEFPPVHASGGQFGRFEAIPVSSERGSLTGSDPIRRTVLPSSEDYETKGTTRAFIVIDASPNDERAGATPPMETVLGEMRQALGPVAADEFVECVYVSRHKAVVEVLSTEPGAADLTRFNRLIEPGLAEHAIQKYTLICYGYDEQTFGWGVGAA